jgi:hypothetical protein
MRVSSAELAVAGELERGKALFALSVVVTVVAGIWCVVCIVRMGLAIGIGPSPPPPPPPPFYFILKELSWWPVAGV